MVLSKYTWSYTLPHVYRDAYTYRKRCACGYRVFARYGDERREERMEEDPCHSVIGERTVPYRAVPCYIVSLCIVSSFASRILSSFFSSLFVLLFPIDSQNSSIFIAVNVAAENTDRIEELNEKSHFESVTTFNLTLFLCSFYHDKIKLEM